MSKRFVKEYAVYVKAKIHGKAELANEKKLDYLNDVDALVRLENSGYISTHETMRRLSEIGEAVKW